MHIEAYKVPTVPFAPSSKVGRQSVVKAIFPLVLLTAGTGGVITANSARELGSWVHNPMVRVARPSSPRVDTRSPAEQVRFVRDTYGLNMSELSSVLGVTRPTAYAWLAGQEPKPEALMHIRLLSRFAEEVVALKIPRLDKLIRRPIFDGLSLRDKLIANENPLPFLPTLKALANKELHARHTQKGSGKNKRSLDEVAGDYSSPMDIRS